MLDTIAMEYRRAESNPFMTNLTDGMDHWEVTLASDWGTTFQCYFSKGSGHHSQPPELNEVLECLCMDYSFADSDPEEWFSMMESAEQYEACKAQNANFLAFMGREDLIYKLQEEIEGADCD